MNVYDPDAAEMDRDRNVLLSVCSDDAVKDFNFLNQRVYERRGQFSDVSAFANDRKKPPAPADRASALL